MKILIIQPWIRAGGAELVSVHLADQLRRQGHKASIVCTYVDLDSLPDQARKIDYMVPNRHLSFLCKNHRLAFLVLAPWVLFYIAWKNSRDADVLNPHNFPAAWIAAVINMLRGIPVLWTCNEPPERPQLRHVLNIGLGDFIGWTLASSWIDRLLVNRFAGIYVPSEMTRHQVRARYGRDPDVNRIGVDPQRFRNSTNSDLVKRLGLEGKFVLLAVGKLHHQKNQIICIQALEHVLQKVPNAVLVLIGDGPMASVWQRRVIEAGLDDKVLFLGHKSSSLIADIYSICDVNLVPALNQSWGLTPFEALCAQKVSIVSNEAGASEVVSRQRIGLVSEATAESFSQEILKVYADPKPYQDMAARGQKFVSQHLTWESYAERVLAQLEDIVGASQESDLELAPHGMLEL